MSNFEKTSNASPASANFATICFKEEPSWYISSSCTCLVVVPLTDRRVWPYSCILKDKSRMMWNALLLWGINATGEILGLQGMCCHGCFTLGRYVGTAMQCSLDHLGRKN
eukprot:882585-Ditylum_brightwellii.AAC.1